MYEYKEKKMKTGIRNIYMDILKIISMFMVVLLHATNFGIQNIKIEIGSINYFIVWIIRIFYRTIFTFMLYSTKWSEIFDKDMYNAKFSNLNI